MLNSIHINNYRGFKEFRLDNLARVNLLTGKNNAGKTALLESVHILAAGGNPRVLRNIARDRGEVAARESKSTGYDIDLSHFFYGHQIAIGSAVSITGGHVLPPVNIEIVPMEAVDYTEDLFDMDVSQGPAFAIRIAGSWTTGLPDKASTFVLSEDGAMLVDHRHGPPRYLLSTHRESPPIVFISTDSEWPSGMVRMWNEITVQKQEEWVYEAMRILEPALEDIRFLGSSESPRRALPTRSGVVVGLTDAKQRIPLGSMGDGMRRLLVLAISLSEARDGYLIIDEIDTGFHYSIMAKMWELVVQTAEANNIQVFATTHSADCVRGLGLLAEQRPDLQHAIAAHKIERDLGHNVAFTGHEVALALEQDIEIR